MPEAAGDKIKRWAGEFKEWASDGGIELNKSSMLKVRRSVGGTRLPAATLTALGLAP